jgi:hypothetical protein
VHTRDAAQPAIKRVIVFYHARFLARFGFRPAIHRGKDGRRIQTLLGTWGEATVTALVAQFLATTDPRVAQSDYSIGALCSLAQHLRLRPHRLDRRTAQNLDAAARASSPRPGSTGGETVAHGRGFRGPPPRPPSNTFTTQPLSTRTGLRAFTNRR